MSFGINIFSDDGKLIYDSNSVTWNQVDMFLVPANSATYRSYPMLNGRTIRATQMFLNPPPVNARAVAHTVSISGTNVSVSGGNQDVYIMVLMQ